MASNYIEEGKRNAITPAVDVTSGQLVMVGDLACMALKNIPAGASGPVAVEGVFELAGKDNTLAINQGQKVYREAASGKLTTVPTGNAYVGIAWATAALAATAVRVKLNA